MIKILLNVWWTTEDDKIKKQEKEAIGEELSFLESDQETRPATFYVTNLAILPFEDGDGENYTEIIFGDAHFVVPKPLNYVLDSVERQISEANAERFGCRVGAARTERH